MNVFFSKLLVEKSGCQTLILPYFLMTHRACSFYTGFAGWIAVRTAHYNHQLVWNIHGAENFRNQIFADIKLRTTNRAFYRLNSAVSFGRSFLILRISKIKDKKGNNKSRSRAHKYVIHNGEKAEKGIRKLALGSKA
jgi:hypothetical protein